MTTNALPVYSMVAAGSVDNSNEFVIPNNKAFVITGISFTAPPIITGAVLIVWDPSGANKIYEVSQGDKFVHMSGVVLSGNGIKKLRVQLNNQGASASAFLGCTIYYEELG